MGKKVISGYNLILEYLGVFILTFGFILLLPLILLPFYTSELKYAICFIIPSLGCFLIGTIITLCYRGTIKGKLVGRQDAVLVTLFWLIAIVILSFPFVISGRYSFLLSLFETTSGITATGLTIVDVANCPHIFLLFRSILMFIGGIGLVLILTCAISDKHGLALFNTEGHSDRLLPNLAKSARLILSIYALYISIGIIAYLIAGLSLFDALNISIAAVSTGGFCTNPNSIGGFNSTAVDIITIVLMLLGCTNFAIHYYLLKRKYKKVWKHCETKFLLIAIIIAVPLLGCILAGNANMGFLDCVRVSSFQFISAITTTGFQNVPSIAALPIAFKTVIIMAMLIGGGIGSTSGGMKQVRVVTAFKGTFFYYKDKLANRRFVRTHYIQKMGEDEILTRDDTVDSLGFILIYLAVFFIGSFLITLCNVPLQDSMFELASALSSGGFSVGVTCATAHPFVLIVLMIGMFFGRLEIFAIFNAFAQVASDMKYKKHKPKLNVD